MPQLTRGQKIDLTDLTSEQTLRIALATASNLHFDFCCFGLNEKSQLEDERYFIFYNQKSAPQNAVCIAGERAGEATTFAVDLTKLPTSVRRLVFTLVVDGEGNLSDLANGQWSILASGVEIARFSFAGRDFGVEKSLIVGEIYFYGGHWRVSAVGQGFREGLSALLKHFGGQEETAPAQNTARDRVSPRSNPTPSAAPNGPVCARCGKVGALNPTTRRCPECEAQVKTAFEHLRADFKNASRTGVMNTDEWQKLWQRFESARTGSNRAQAMEFLRPDALQFLEQLVAMATSDEIITPVKESYVRQMCAFLEIPTHQRTPFFARLEQAKIRWGRLPTVSASDFHLDSDELCHLNVRATYHKVGAHSTTLVEGRLLATSKKLIFIEPPRGRTIQYNSIMAVHTSGDSILLQLSTQSGGGRYSVQDAEHCEAVITAKTQLVKRQMLPPQSGKPSRHIPQDVATAVWQRDGGKCVQCGASGIGANLELDHKIPFSKGGANTVGNIQLLCRKCNGEKGNKI